jgi:hypothetical protein
MRKLVTLSFAVVVVALSAFALYSVFLKGQPAAAQSTSGDKTMVISVEKVINGETTSGTVAMTFAQSAELPDTTPNRAGLFVARAGDRLTIGDGAIQVEANVEVVNDEEPVTTLNATHSGAEVQLRVTDTTAIYADITERPDVTAEMLKAGSVTIPSRVVAGSLDEIGDNTYIRAWGTFDGDVLVTDVLVYEAIK